MYRLTILLASCLSVFTAMSELASAQNKVPEIKVPVKSPVITCRFPLHRAIKMTLESTGPINVTNEEIKKVNEYEHYLKMLNGWQLEALEVAERLEKEDKLYPPRKTKTSPNISGGVSPIHYWRKQIRMNQNARVSFPKSVVNEMRPAPSTVSRPPSTETTLVLKLTNDSDRSVTFNDDIYCDICQVKISVKGPEVFRIPKCQLAQAAVWLPGRAVTLKPGEEHKIKIKRLRFGNRGTEGWSLRSPGEHQITVEYSGSVARLGAKANQLFKMKAMATVDVRVEELPPIDRTIKNNKND